VGDATSVKESHDDDDGSRRPRERLDSNAAVINDSGHDTNSNCEIKAHDDIDNDDDGGGGGCGGFRSQCST